MPAEGVTKPNNCHGAKRKKVSLQQAAGIHKLICSADDVNLRAMERLTTLRGFRDIYGDEIGRFRLIEETARTFFGLLGYKEIEVPVLEKTELFKRSIGDTTDIVEKEMFTFTIPNFLNLSEKVLSNFIN